MILMGTLSTWEMEHKVGLMEVKKKMANSLVLRMREMICNLLENCEIHKIIHQGHLVIGMGKCMKYQHLRE